MQGLPRTWQILVSNDISSYSSQLRRLGTPRCPRPNLMRYWSRYVVEGMLKPFYTRQIHLTNPPVPMRHSRSGTLGVYRSSSSPLVLFLISTGHHTPRMLRSIIEYHGRRLILVFRQVDNRFRLLWAPFFTLAEGKF